VVNLDELF